MRCCGIVYAMLLTILLAPWSRVSGGEQLMYVGTYTGKGSEGIYGFRFNPATGDIYALGLAARTENPSFLAVDREGRFLFAVNEIDTFMQQPSGSVSVFAVEKASGALTFLQQVSSLGAGPAHVSLDRSGKFLMVANYGGGNVAVFPIGPDGPLGHHTALMQASGSSVNLQRQAGPHAHAIQVTCDNRLALVADLGIDKILAYDFDERTGTLAADSLKTYTLDPGAGPRHLAMVPSGEFVYVVNELASSVVAFRYNAARGTLERLQMISTLPEKFAGINAAAEIIVDTGGRFLYVSNRGDNTIVVFSIDPGSGHLSFAQRIPCGGRTPRNITLDPTGGWLFSANQSTGMITVFQVDPKNGHLTATSRSVKVVSPVSITFIPCP